MFSQNYKQMLVSRRMHFWKQNLNDTFTPEAGLDPVPEATRNGRLRDTGYANTLLKRRSSKSRVSAPWKRNKRS